MWRLQRMLCADAETPIPSAFRAVEHDLLTYERAGTIYVAGPPTAKHIVFFVGGFPDDQRAFLSLAKRMADAGCLVGVGCMPDFDRIAKGLEPLRRWGWSFVEDGECIAQAIAALRAQSSTRAQLTVVAHDFGVTPALHFVNTSSCDRLVILDYLIAEEGFSSVYDAITILNYMIILGWVFFLSRFSTWLAQLWLWPLLVLTEHASFVFPASPTLDKKCASITRMSFDLMSGYYQGCRLAFHPREARELEKCLSVSLGVRRQPTLFIYGKEKNVAYHTPKQLGQIREAGGKVLAVDGAGHWVHHHQEDICFDAIKDFIFEPAAKPKRGRSPSR